MRTDAVLGLSIRNAALPDQLQHSRKLELSSVFSEPDAGRFGRYRQ
jgi:hypothetical protein